MHPEVLIIGGGVIGLSIARELHKQGVKRITLLEKGSCGKEASWAAAGMLSPQVEADESSSFLDLCCASRDLYRTFAEDLLDETGIDIELDRTGTLYLAFDDEEVEKIHKRYEWQQKAGLAVELLSQDRLRAVEPSISPNAREALLFPNDWQVENRHLVSALRAYAEKNGINIQEAVKVEEILVENDSVKGVVTNAGTVTADTTVIATGAWTSLIKLGQVGMPLRIEPVRGQILAFRPAQTMLDHVVCCSSGYLVPRLDGRILAGSTTEHVGFDNSVTDIAASSLTAMSCELVPAFAGLEIADHWAGLRPFAFDGFPVMGSITSLEGHFIATAHYRNGILLAPLTAKLVAEKLVNGTDPDHFASFGVERFARRSMGTGL